MYSCFYVNQNANSWTSGSKKGVENDLLGLV